MKKEFLHPITIRNNAIVLSEKMCNDGVCPSVIYVGLRGGATFGNVISEYYKLRTKAPHTPLYAAVVAHSYTKYSSHEVRIDGWTYPPQFIRPNDTVMLVDDIFDSGKTIVAIAQEMMRQGVTRDRLIIVVHDYKERKFLKQKHDILPDYYSRKIVTKTPEEDGWIHYLSHELDGLEEEEIREHYPFEIVEIIRRLLKRRERIKTSK